MVDNNAAAAASEDAGGEDNTALLGEADAAAAAAAAAAANGKANGKDGKAADAAAADGEADPDGEQTNQEWFKDFLTDLDKSEAMSFRNMASRYKAPNEFARAHLNMHKSAVFLPKDDDKDKDQKWDKVFERLGKPKDAKDYKFTDPKDFEFDDIDREYRESFRSVAHRARLTQSQVQFLEGWQIENAKLMRDAQKTAQEEGPRKARNVLRSRWSNEFDSNINHANMAFKHYAGTKAGELLQVRLSDGSFLRDHPEFVAMMARVGRDRAEDDTTINPMNEKQAQTARSQIEKLENDALVKGLDPTSPLWPHKQLEPLYAKAYGTKAIRQDGVRNRE